jgi:hypothetical protein
MALFVSYTLTNLDTVIDTRDTRHPRAVSAMQVADHFIKSLIQIIKVVLRRMHMQLAGKCSDREI